MNTDDKEIQYQVDTDGVVHLVLEIEGAVVYGGPWYYRACLPWHHQQLNTNTRIGRALITCIGCIVEMTQTGDRDAAPWNADLRV